MDLAQFMLAAQKNAASDLFLSSSCVPALRVHGEVVPFELPPVAADEVSAMLASVTTEEQRAAFASTRELDFGVTFRGQRLRGNAAWADGEPSLAFRLIPDQVAEPGELRLPPVLTDFVQRTSGLLLFTGAAGQGKSTSQASLVDFLNRRKSMHVVTVEDPIEYRHQSRKCIIEQREVGRDTRSFANGLRHVLRQSPDVIQIGEMRDRESVEAALLIAETGHLVMSTLHAADAVQAIERVASMFPVEQRDFVCTQMSATLIAVVNQRLVRNVRKGRTLAAEVLVNNHAVANAIRDGKFSQLYSAMELDAAGGARTMNRALQELVDDGEVHVAEARRFLNRMESGAEALAGGGGAA
jgi:twitching motility protein PilT